jgi:hypothetical protein
MDDEMREVVAKQAITDVLYRYCRALDRMDRALASSVWHAGGTADYGGLYSGTGEGFIDWVWDVHTQFSSHSHQITNVLISVDGGRAVSEAYVTVALRLVAPDGAVSDSISRGRYLDRLTLRDGRWAIDHREYVNDVGPTTVTGSSADALPSSARRSTEDPSYAIFD